MHPDKTTFSINLPLLPSPLFLIRPSKHMCMWRFKILRIMGAHKNWPESRILKEKKEKKFLSLIIFNEIRGFWVVFFLEFYVFIRRGGGGWNSAPAPASYASATALFKSTVIGLHNVFDLRLSQCYKFWILVDFLASRRKSNGFHSFSQNAHLRANQKWREESLSCYLLMVCVNQWFFPWKYKLIDLNF